MKRLLSVLLALAMVLGLAVCGSVGASAAEPMPSFEDLWDEVCDMKRPYVETDDELTEEVDSFLFALLLVKADDASLLAEFPDHRLYIEMIEDDMTSGRSGPINWDIT
ncbi:MAG: hypothetical protein LBB75_04960, partial [Oscillospiraceae bacterium]|nr:hypothetical protein [Oscillospiraceae bacterium]